MQFDTKNAVKGVLNTLFLIGIGVMIAGIGALTVINPDNTAMFDGYLYGIITGMCITYLIIFAGLRLENKEIIQKQEVEQ